MSSSTEQTQPFAAPRPTPWQRVRGLDGVLAAWRDNPRYQGQFVYDATRAATAASFGPLPESLEPRIARALAARGQQRLFVHQIEAFEAAARGEHVVLATPTASGKSLAYNLPVLDALARDPNTRALYMFPTKALSRDQEAAMRALLCEVGLPANAITYDGDTPAEIRRNAREQGGLLLTNPDMLHSGILPYHTSWARFFAGLKYVIIDELHVYRGVFGSHLANVLRRLRRVAAFYGASPQFLCASATIANASEHASELIGAPVVAIEKSGAPRAAQQVMIYNPPVVNAELGLRRSVVTSATQLTLDLIKAGVSTLLFGQSRNSIEVMLKYLRDGAAKDPSLDSDSIHSYRGGYLPTQRRRIEERLRNGEIRCIVATQALELGIDIGALDAVVCAGYPGSIAGLWQRFGRGGRRNQNSLALWVASSTPIDQYFAMLPEVLMSAAAEQARIDANNIEIFMQHLKCAAFELPFRAGDAFGNVASEAVSDGLAFLAQHQTLHPVPHQDGLVYHWAAPSAPATNVSLRQIGWDNFVIIDVKDDKVLAEMDWRSAHTMLHEQAIYQHVASQYQVERLDYENRKAFVRLVEPDYYTDAMTHLKLTPTDIFEHAPTPWPNAQGLSLTYGDVSIVERVVGFKKIRFHTHENVGFGEVNLPELQKHTTAIWLEVDPALIDSIATRLGCPPSVLIDGLRGLAHALKLVAAVGLMIDPRDLGHEVSDEPKSAASQKPFAPTVYIFDAMPGGVGLSPRLYAAIGELMNNVATLLLRCTCNYGCPRCTGVADGVKVLQPAYARKALAKALLGAMGIDVPETQEDAPLH